MPEFSPSMTLTSAETVGGITSSAIGGVALVAQGLPFGTREAEPQPAVLTVSTRLRSDNMGGS